MRTTALLSCLTAMTLAGCDSSTMGTDDAGVDLGGVVGDDLGLDPMCPAISQQVELLPLDMLLLLDTSGSMDFDLKWPSVQAALKGFVADPRFTGLGVGLQYFPLRKQCDLASYQTPAVPVATLPMNSAALSASLDEKRMSGGTPMTQALEGMMVYAKGLAAQAVNRKTVIVLTTDGIPDDTCAVPTGGGLANSLDNVKQIAEQGFTESPAVPTFVIGVGSELTALNEIAQKGGTGNAILVDTAQDIQTAFSAAIDSVRRTALACEFTIPEGAATDPTLLNVRFDSGGASSFFGSVGTLADCSRAPTQGWYYDDPAMPTKVLLCPETCNRVKGALDGKIEVVFGCATIIL